MIVPNTVRRMALPVAAFVLVGTGAMLALPGSSEPDSTTTRQPTVVLVDSVSAGTPSLEVRSRAEVRDLEASARAEGALSSLDDIPAGVLSWGVCSIESQGVCS